MYRFIQIQDAGQMAMACKLRYQVYCEEKKWLDGGGYPGGEEKDAYDGHSVLFLALDREGRAVGTIRIIVKNDRISLPIGLNFRTEKQHFGKGCEISRMAVPKDCRRGNVSIGLIRIAVHHMIAHKDELKDLYIAVEDRFLLTLNLLGFEFMPIGPPAFCCGDMLIPSWHRVAELEPSLKRNNSRFHEWFMEDPHFMGSGGGSLMNIFTRTGNRNFARTGKGP